MPRRVRSFGDDTDLGHVLFTDIEEFEGGIFRLSGPPGPERQKTLSNIQTQLEKLASSLDSDIDRLREIVRAYEPVELVSSIAIPTSMALWNSPNWEDDGRQTASWAAKLEYLVGVTMSMEPGQRSTPQDVTERVMALIDRIFRAAIAKNLLDNIADQRSDNELLDATRFQLRLEYLVDRMHGYAIHLESIDAEVFDRHRNHYVRTLGFNPADVIRLVRRHAREANQRVTRALNQIRRSTTPNDADHLRGTLEFLRALTESREWAVDRVAKIAAIPRDEARRLLEFFAADWNSQPDFRYPWDENLARECPCIRIGTTSTSFRIPGLLQ